MHSPSRNHYAPLPRSAESSPTRPQVPHRLSPLHRKFYLLYRFLILTFLTFLCLTIFTGLYNPSYTYAPSYTIPPNERVYIAANIIDGQLIDGVWGESLSKLVNAIGKDRVYVSVYGGPQESLLRLEKRLDLGDRATILAESESPIPLANIPHIQLPNGAQKIKRIAYLAEVRNKALEPLGRAQEKFDKVLFINDVVFKPADALRLLWGTRVVDGKASYRAACAVDFVNPFKFYDTFATRDLEGYSIGLPIYPWFANVGDANSRKDVLGGTDAVRVRSCWGGMVAFDAAFFQDQTAGDSSSDESEIKRDDGAYTSTTTPPLRFRSETDPFWDASECCLIHADIQSISNPPSPDDSSPDSTGIYMNPFVRVAYSPFAYKLTFAVARFEKLFAKPQALISWLADLPRRNPRRGERAGEVVRERVWVLDEAKAEDVGGEDGMDGGLGGQKGKDDKGLVDLVTASRAEIEEAARRMAELGEYRSLDRVASTGGFCGTRQLLVMRFPGDVGVEGQNWVNLVIPLPEG